MKPIQGYDSINEAGEFKRLPAGIYGGVITGVTDYPDKEYLEFTCDITKGEYKDYFKLMISNGLKDQSRFIRSYKANALPFFKASMTAIEKCNEGYKWDWNESKLVGKKVILVFGEEEYIDKDGNVKLGTKLVEFRSLEAYKEGRIKIPEVKKVTEEDLAKWKAENAPSTVEESSPVVLDDDLPF